VASGEPPHARLLCEIMRSRPKLQRRLGPSSTCKNKLTSMFRVLQGVDRNFREDSTMNLALRTVQACNFLKIHLSKLCKAESTINELVNKLNEILEHLASSSCHV
jgi:hypothetical protein